MGSIGPSGCRMAAPEFIPLTRGLSCSSASFLSLVFGSPLSWVYLSPDLSPLLGVGLSRTLLLCFGHLPQWPGFLHQGPVRTSGVPARVPKPAPLPSWGWSPQLRSSWVISEPASQPVPTQWVGCLTHRVGVVGEGGPPLSPQRVKGSSSFPMAQEIDS